MPIPFVVVAADVAGLTLLAKALNSSSSSLTKFVLRLCCAEHREVVVARKKRKADTQKGINATNGDRIASEGPSERRSKRKKETVSRNTVSVAPIVAADATGGKCLRPESVEVLQRPMKDTRNDESPSPLNSLTPPRGEAIVAETISMPKFFAINSPQLVKVSEPCTGQKYAGPIMHGEYDDAASLCGSSHSLEDAYDIDFALVSNTLSTQEPSDDDCTLCAMDQQKQDTVEAARNNSMSEVVESIAGKLNEEDSAAEPPETTGEEGKRAAEHPETIAGYKEEDNKRDDAFEHPEIMSEDGYHAAQVTDANVDEEFATQVPKDNTCVAQWSEQSFHKNDTVSLQAENNVQKKNHTIQCWETISEEGKVQEMVKSENGNEEEMEEEGNVKTTVEKDERQMERDDERKEEGAEGEETNSECNGVENDGECNGEENDEGPAAQPQAIAKDGDRTMKQFEIISVEGKEKEEENEKEDDNKVYAMEQLKTTVEEGDRLIGQDEEKGEEDDGQVECDDEGTISGEENRMAEHPVTMDGEECQAVQCTETMEGEHFPIEVLQISADEEKCAGGTEPDTSIPKDDTASEQPETNADMRSSSSGAALTDGLLRDSTAFEIPAADAEIPTLEDVDADLTQSFVAKAMSGFMSLDGVRHGSPRSPRAGRAVPQVLVTTTGTGVPQVEFDMDHNVHVELQHGEQVMVQMVGGSNMSVQIPRRKAEDNKDESNSREKQLANLRANREPTIDSSVVSAYWLVEDTSPSSRNGSGSPYRFVRDTPGSQQ
eukprot:GEMP01010594.1.p1 GENE.GEMP01010594.1~~GEMP01010594.1.p1  ORF type:complete len:774 (+),score=204.76 GEMP01010594.1:323-2644(+)